METIRNPSFSAEDKLRVLLCYFLSSPDNAVLRDDLTEYERALKDAGASLGPLEYVKK